MVIASWKAYTTGRGACCSKAGWEAHYAVRFLESACRQELATPSLVQKVVSFLKCLEWTPGLQFTP